MARRGRNFDHREGLPPNHVVEDWLLERERARVGGQPSRRSVRSSSPPHLLSVPHRFDVGGFFRRHVLFTVEANRGLPQPRRQSWGTRGLFAYDGEHLLLLRPDDDSLARLAQREGRPIREADATPFARFIAHLVLGSAVHSFIEYPEELRGEQWIGFRLDETEFERVTPPVDLPSLTSQGGGSDYRSTGSEHVVRFLTVMRGMSWSLGIETVHISGEFAIRRGEREVLSSRIFSRVPGTPV